MEYCSGQDSWKHTCKVALNSLSSDLAASTSVMWLAAEAELLVSCNGRRLKGQRHDRRRNRPSSSASFEPLSFFMWLNSLYFIPTSHVSYPTPPLFYSHPMYSIIFLSFFFAKAMQTNVVAKAETYVHMEQQHGALHQMCWKSAVFIVLIACSSFQIGRLYILIVA
jgi:hypothetical protein